MLGDFINRILILILGYAYPGFECYKTLEKNRVDIEELRFWCKYWIIVALFTVLEKFTDIFVGWLPMYGEMKLVFFVYLWYPKTKGTGFIYETVLRPYVSKHENEIDRKLMEWKARGWDYVIFYWQYCAKFGQTAFVQALQHLASQSNRMSNHPNTKILKYKLRELKYKSIVQDTIQNTSSTHMQIVRNCDKVAPRLQKNERQDQRGPEQATPAQGPAQGQAQASFRKQGSTLSKSKKWPPSPPVTPKSQTVEIHHDSHTQYNENEQEWEPEPISIEAEDQSVSVKNRISQARASLRRLDSQNSQNSRTPRTPPRR